MALALLRPHPCRCMCDRDLDESVGRHRQVVTPDGFGTRRAAALGTTTLKDTVNESLRNVVVAAGRRKTTMEDIAAFAEAAKDLGDPEGMAKAWE